MQIDVCAVCVITDLNARRGFIMEVRDAAKGRVRGGVIREW